MELEHTKRICEIYINGDRTKAKICKRIDEFLRMFDILLSFSANTFYVYCSSNSEKLFRELLKLYIEKYPEITISIKGEKSTMNKKADFVVVFDWETEIMAYTKEFARITLSNRSDNPITSDEMIYDLTRIDLMD